MLDDLIPANSKYLIRVPATSRAISPDPGSIEPPWIAMLAHVAPAGVTEVRV